MRRYVTSFIRGDGVLSSRLWMVGKFTQNKDLAGGIFFYGLIILMLFL